MVENQIVVYDAPIWTVYMHVNKINGKKYVGITSQQPEKRWKHGHGYNRSVFANAIKKYGWDNFEHIVLLSQLTKFVASIMEIYYIKIYNTCVQNNGNGYNWQSGGFSGAIGIKPTIETIEKISNKVVCVNTGTVYCSQEEASRFFSHNSAYIGAVCRGEAQSSGKDENGNPLIWMYYEDYEQLSELQIEKIKNRMILPNTARPVICINNEKIFVSAVEASNYCGSNAASITRCCQTYNKNQTGHPRYHAGTDPITHEWMAWMYLDEYNCLTDIEKRDLLKQSHPQSTHIWNRPIICLNSLEIFESATNTIGLTTLADNKGVQIACKKAKITEDGLTRSGGRNPITKEKLYWMYKNDYDSLSTETKIRLKAKHYTGNFLLPKNQKEVNNNDNK